MDCQYEVIWTEPAIEDLRSLVDHIGLSGPETAKDVGHAIARSVEILRTFPLIGPAYPVGSRGRTREITCKNYRIFYRFHVRRRIVEILSVCHGSRQDPDLEP